MMRRRVCGQGHTEWLLAIAFIALIAATGFQLFKQNTGTSAAQLASVIGGETATAVEQRAGLDTTPLPAGPEPEADDAFEPLEYAKGVLQGIYQNLLDELSLFLSPIETLTALYSLGVMLAEDLAGTAQNLLDELLLEPLDTLLNGTPYEKGFVVGQQISPTKALSVVSKLAIVGAAVAPAKRASNQVVIGRFQGVDGHPGYTELADRLGARYFSVPAEVWDTLTPDQQVTANITFLDRAIARGDEIVLAQPITFAERGSGYFLEIEHLRRRGYTFSPDGTRAIPPGAR